MPSKNGSVFVINLDSATERMEKMSKQLNEIGIDFERFSATKGTALSQNDIDNEYCNQLNKKYFRADLSLGEIGCYISHKNVWKKIVADNLEYAIILEDDLVIEPNFIDVFEQFPTLKKYDLIKLADNRDHKPTQKLNLNKQFELVNFNKIPNCATGYILNLSGAKKLLSREKFYRPVDIDMQFCKELELSVYGLRPYPITENQELISDIVTLNGGFHGKKTTSFIRNAKYRIHLWWFRKNYISGVL